MRRLFLVLTGITVVALGAAWAADPAPSGKEIYASVCADCHRVSGEGLAAAFPALKGNPFVTGEAKPLIQLILDGRKGKVGRMPSWKDQFTDPQIAAVATYIRQAWGNQAAPITPELVAPLRK